MGNKKGYTLIEILVGLTIIGLLFSFGFASFRDFSRRQGLAGTVKSVQGNLRLAQELALAGQKPENALCTGSGRILDKYSFNVVSLLQYRIEAECSDALGSYVVVVKEANLPSDVSISTPTPNPIEFKVLGHGNNIIEGGTATITLTQAGTGSQTAITITAGGEIK